MTLSVEFQKNPVTFLRKYALSPPDGAPGAIVKTWSITNNGNILEGANGPLNSKVKLRMSGGVGTTFSDFKKHPLFPGCLTVSLSPTRTSDDQFCQHWLPWDSLSITKHRIAPVPTNIVGGSEDLDEYPRFFMTAGINGCSVFVEGPPHSPTVYHAGITGKLAKPAVEFWKDQFRMALGRDPKPGVGQVHSHEYMKKDADVINRYVEWVSSQKEGPFRMEVTSCFGSVIGVRYGRLWSFYLQENAYVQDLQILKRSQVTREQVGNLPKTYMVKGSREIVTREDIVVKRRFLGDTRKKLFLRGVNARCVPVRVSEIYPTRQFSGELKDMEVRAL